MSALPPDPVLTMASALPVLSHSRMKTYRECQRLHKLRYTDGWQPVRASDALRFGTLVHAGLEAFWRGEDIDAALAGEADPFERVKAEELLRGYARRYSRDAYDVLGVEVEFNAPLLNPDTFLPSRTWRLGGKLDVVVRVRATGQVAVIEHKTTADDLMDPDYWSRLAMDPQISTYVLGAESLGYEVTDTIYDVIRKPGIRPLKATPVESRKYKQNGDLYAAQRDRDETPDEYAARLRADIEENPARYYAQRQIPRLHSQIREYMEDAWALGREIREAELAGRAVRNPDACMRYGKCSFWDLCANGLKPEEHPEMFTQRPAPVHPEPVS